jgi:hypothetical protein
MDERIGRLLRGVMRRIMDGKRYKILSTIDDPTVLKRIEEAVRMASLDQRT